jgi:TonB-dependent SusC/RagA subfamily outer membrane receptor
MENFIFYLLKAGIWITVFGLIYRLFLRKETFFKFNRFFLLLGLPASFALALCQYHYPVNLNLQLALTPETVATQSAQTGFVVGWPVVIAAIYIAGTLLLLIHYLIGLNKIGRLIRAQKSKFNTKPPIIEIPQIQSSFSFFGYVFMDKTANLSEVEKRLILEHETAHVEQYHWLDLFLSQLVCALQWFNPFAWLYRNAIKQNHEFLADRSVIQKGNSQAVYHAALINYTLKAPVFALTNSFAYHKFKRIAMMKKNVSKPAKKFAALLLIPALAAFLWAFAKPEYKYSIAIQQEPEATALKDTVIIITDKEPEGITIVTPGKVKKVKTKTEEQSLNSDSVIVIGYGSMRKEIIGDSIRSLSSTIFKKSDKNSHISGNITGLNFHSTTDKKPLIILDGKEISAMEGIAPGNVHSISVLRNEKALELYGEQAKNGIVLITSKKFAEETGEKAEYIVTDVPRQENSILDVVRIVKGKGNPLVIVDGKEFDNIEKVKPEDIESLSVLKDKSATDMYGEKGKNGVIIIKTK